MFPWGGSVALREDFGGLELRKLAKQTKDAVQARRLLALAEIYDGGSRTDAARIGSVTLQVIRDEYYGREIPNYVGRFAVKPGLTGWAQVNGSRGETPTVADMRHRVDLDLWYVQNRTLALDFTILARTVVDEITRRTNAY
jgi:hypothetical protein